MGSQGAQQSRSEFGWSSYNQRDRAWVVPVPLSMLGSPLRTQRKLEPGANPGCHPSTAHQNGKWKQLPTILVLTSALLLLPGVQGAERKLTDQELCEVHCVGLRARSQRGVQKGPWNKKDWKIGSRAVPLAGRGLKPQEWEGGTEESENERRGRKVSRRPGSQSTKEGENEGDDCPATLFKKSQEGQYSPSDHWGWSWNRHQETSDEGGRRASEFPGLFTETGSRRVTEAEAISAGREANTAQKQWGWKMHTAF